MEAADSLGKRLICGSISKRKNSDDDVVEPRIDAGGYEDIAEIDVEGETQTLETVKRAFTGFLIEQLMAK